MRFPQPAHLRHLVKGLGQGSTRYYSPAADHYHQTVNRYALRACPRLVKLTHEHIRAGEPCSARRCPLAYAIRSAYTTAFAPVHDVLVGVSMVSITFMLAHEPYVATAKFNLPRDLARRVDAYDRRKRTLEPCTFTLLPTTA